MHPPSRERATEPIELPDHQHVAWLDELQSLGQGAAFAHFAGYGWSQYPERLKDGLFGAAGCFFFAGILAVMGAIWGFAVGAGFRTRASDSCPAICCATSSLPPFCKYVVMPVARKLWQLTLV